MASQVIFVKSTDGFELTNQTFNEVRNMYEAVALHANGCDRTILYNLSNDVSLASPVYTHNVLGVTICTNNVAAFLFQIIGRAFFWDAEETKAISISRCDDLSMLEVIILEKANSFFPQDFLERLAEYTNGVLREKTFRLEHFRCIIHEMKKSTDLRPAAQQLETAYHDLDIQMLKHLTNAPK